MKRIFFLIMIFSSAIMAMADNYKYLNIEKTDGTVFSLTANGLTITFDNGNLNAVNGAESATIKIGDLRKMYFSNSNDFTGNAAVQADALKIGVQGRQVYVTAPTGVNISIYHINGMLVGEYKTHDATSEAIGPMLSQGIYIVRIGEQSFKIQIR